MAGDPVAACWSHQLGHSPAQDERSLHLAQPSPRPSAYRSGHPYLSPLTRQWLSQLCQGSILNLVAGHRATGCCPLHSQGLTAWLGQHQVSWTGSHVIGWERGNGQSERRIGGRQLGCGTGGQGSGAQRVASAPPGQDRRTAPQLGARSTWGGGGVRGPGQGTRGGQGLTGQGHRDAASSGAHSPGNEGQQGPQDAEVVDEEEEIAGRLRGHSLQLLGVSVLDP